jgi:hypothetical protein
VLTADPDPNEPLDLTNGFVSGNGDRFSGGVTAANGTAKTAVRSTGATPTGVPGGQGKTEAAPPTQDLSRPAKPIQSSLNCTDLWPPDTDQNLARVRVLVSVDADGRPKDVTILQDPGDGFGAAAKRCIMARGKFEAGLDSAGRPLAKPTVPFILKFQR